MATPEKPTALQTNLQQAEQAFSNLLTPEEEAPIEENQELVEEAVEEIEEVTEETEVELEAAEEIEETDEEVLEENQDESIEDQVEHEESEQPELYTVKQNGIEAQVTLEELQNGYSRQQDYTRKTQELANQRKEIESQQAELSQKDEVYRDLLPKLEASLEAELGKEPDWKQLYENDPISYVREKDVWNEKKKQLEATKAEQQRLKDDEIAKQREQIEQFIQFGNQELLNKVPEWKDSEKANSEKIAIRDYAINSLGFTAEEMDQVYDYRILLGLRNSWLHDKTVKATKKKPTQKSAARVARPGTANQVKKSTPLKQSKQRLAKSGKVQDAAKVFENLI
jgi:hypothetical protein